MSITLPIILNSFATIALAVCCVILQRQYNYCARELISLRQKTEKVMNETYAVLAKHNEALRVASLAIRKLDNRTQSLRMNDYPQVSDVPEVNIYAADLGPKITINPEDAAVILGPAIQPHPDFLVGVPNENTVPNS